VLPNNYQEHDAQAIAKIDSSTRCPSTGIATGTTREGWCQEFTQSAFHLHWTTQENHASAVKDANQDVARVQALASPPRSRKRSSSRLHWRWSAGSLDRPASWSTENFSGVRIGLKKRSSSLFTRRAAAGPSPQLRAEHARMIERWFQRLRFRPATTAVGTFPKHSPAPSCYCSLVVTRHSQPDLWTTVGAKSRNGARRMRSLAGPLTAVFEPAFGRAHIGARGET